VAGVDRDPLGAVGADHEVGLGVGAVELRAADRVAGEIAPVEEGAVEREPGRGADAGDEVGQDIAAVQVRAADRAALRIRPVEVVGVDGDPLRVDVEEARLDVRSVEGGAADRASARRHELLGAGPVDVGVAGRRKRQGGEQDREDPDSGLRHGSDATPE
jgi:hypothetical protein